MMNSSKTLAKTLSEARANIEPFIKLVIDSLIQVASDLNLEECAARFRKIQELLASDTFNLIMVGQSRNGKSTLLNALLGSPTQPVSELSAAKGALPEENYLLCTTAVITNIRYGEGPLVQVWHIEAEGEEPAVWSLRKYLDEAVFKDNREENEQFFENIREFELFYPAELCKSGVTAINAPDSDEEPESTEIIRQSIEHCDGTIVIYRYDIFGRETEIKFPSEVEGKKTRVFTVINVYEKEDQPLNWQRLKRFVWNRLITEHQNGPKYDGQDFSTQNIYFVNAKQGLLGKFNHDQQLLEQSKLLEFEKALGDFLIRDRYKLHVEAFVSKAEICTKDLQAEILAHRIAIEKDIQELQQAYADIQARLVNLDECRDKLPATIDSLCRTCQQALKSDFEQFITQFQIDITKRLKKHQLSSLEKHKLDHFINMSSLLPLAIAKEVEQIYTTELSEMSNTLLSESRVLSTFHDSLQQVWNKIKEYQICKIFLENNQGEWEKQYLDEVLSHLLFLLESFHPWMISIEDFDKLDMSCLEQKIWQNTVSALQMHLASCSERFSHQVSIAVDEIFAKIKILVMEEVLSPNNLEKYKNLNKAAEDNQRCQTVKEHFLMIYQDASKRVDSQRCRLKEILLTLQTPELTEKTIQQ